MSESLDPHAGKRGTRVLPPFNGKPISRRGIPIQYYAQEKIPEIILVLAPKD